MVCITTPTPAVAVPSVPHESRRGGRLPGVTRETGVPAGRCGSRRGRPSTDALRYLAQFVLDARHGFDCRLKPLVHLRLYSGADEAGRLGEHRRHRGGSISTEEAQHRAVEVPGEAGVRLRCAPDQPLVNIVTAGSCLSTLSARSLNSARACFAATSDATSENTGSLGMPTMSCTRCGASLFCGQQRPSCWPQINESVARRHHTGSAGGHDLGRQPLPPSARVGERGLDRKPLPGSASAVWLGACPVGPGRHPTPSSSTISSGGADGAT